MIINSHLARSEGDGSRRASERTVIISDVVAASVGGRETEIEERRLWGGTLRIGDANGVAGIEPNTDRHIGRIEIILSAVGSRSSSYHCAAAVEQLDGDTVYARLASILNAIFIFIQPYAIADFDGCRRTQHLHVPDTCCFTEGRAIVCCRKQLIAPI